MLILLDRSAHELAQRLTAYLREQCVWLETSDDTLSAAMDLQEEMLAAGMHREPIPDLIIVSVAQVHDAVLVHHDRDFVDIATVAIGLRTRWIVCLIRTLGSRTPAALPLERNPRRGFDDSFTRPG